MTSRVRLCRALGIVPTSDELSSRSIDSELRSPISEGMDPSGAPPRLRNVIWERESRPSCVGMVPEKYFALMESREGGGGGGGGH